MTKFQIALIILAILAVIAVPTVTYLSSTGAFGQAETGHEFTADWSSNADSHWRACTEAGCKEAVDKAEHAFNEGVGQEGKRVLLFSVNMIRTLLMVLVLVPYAVYVFGVVRT